MLVFNISSGSSNYQEMLVFSNIYIEDKQIRRFFTVYWIYGETYEAYRKKTLIYDTK